MAAIDDFRAKYPQYNDMPDEQLAQAVYKKYPEYQDMPVADFTAKFIGAPQKKERVPRGFEPVTEQTAKMDVDQDGFISPYERELIQKMNPVEAFLVGMGRGGYTIGRGLGFVEPEAPEVTRAAEAQKEEMPGVMTAGEIVGESAPFLIPGAGVGAIGSTAGRVGATAGLGALEGGLIARGQGRSGEEQATTAGIAGTVAGGLELAMPYVGRIGGALVRKVFGKEPAGAVVDAAGNPSPELVQALEREGLTFDDVVAQAQSMAGLPLDEQQAARKLALESEGLTPTRAQVTREASDFQAQQEAAKTSGRVREALEEQEKVLTTRFGQAIEQTGGRATTETNPVIDSVVNKATVLDDRINELYKIARETAPTEKNVKFNFLGSRLKSLMPQNTASGGRVEAVVGELQQMGVMDDQFNIVGKISVEQAEDVRKLINSLYDAQNPVGNGVLRQMKDALDDDVFSASGQDVFNQARTAKREFEKELERAGISKFDSRKANLVRDLLENKINPETMVNDVAFSKKWRAEDLSQLQKYLATDEAGQQAWNDMRAQVLEEIKSRAFIGPEDAQGFQALSRDKLEKAIESIGEGRLKVLFSDEERKFLNKMLGIAKLREPVRGTQQGMGPSAQAISALEKTISEIPILGGLWGATVDASGRIALRAKPARKPVTIDASGARSAIAVGGGAAASQAMGEDNGE